MLNVIRCFTEDYGITNYLNKDKLLLITRINVSYLLYGKFAASISANHFTGICGLLLPYISFQFPFKLFVCTLVADLGGRVF
jgi:hypothetical protein